MADISDNGSFNLGLANIASNNFGPTATTNNANTAANTQVQQQSAQAAAMQNQLTRARLPLILARLHSMQPQTDDQSGVGGTGSGQVGQQQVLPREQQRDRRDGAEDEDSVREHRLRGFPARG